MTTPDDTTEATPAAEVEERPEEPAEGHEEAPAEQEPGEQETEGTDPLSAARLEAAGYRRRLRQTEADRDALRTTLDTYRRREVEQMAEAGVGGFGTNGMQSGADLWVAGAQLGDLLGEDGSRPREDEGRRAGCPGRWSALAPPGGGRRPGAAEVAPLGQIVRRRFAQGAR